MKVYCDGVFDLFHSGHVRHFKLIKETYPGCQLTVGVMSDDDATNYKRKPIYKQEDRYLLVSSCRYVDDVVEGCPLFIENSFLDERGIDLVVHAFKDADDYNNQKQYFQNINFTRLPYYGDISTTDIILKKSQKVVGNSEKDAINII